MTFIVDEIPSDIKLVITNDKENQLRCPHYIDGKGEVCNKLLCIGKASTEPQEFKCPKCKNKTIFKRL